MDDSHVLSMEALAFEDLFDLDVRVEAAGKPMSPETP